MKTRIASYLIISGLVLSVTGYNTMESTAGSTMSKSTGVADKPLYDHLGGKSAITAVADDSVGRVAADSRINGKFGDMRKVPEATIQNRREEKLMSNKEKIQNSVQTLYGKVFNEGRGDLLPGLIAGPYIQHNPLFPNGPEPLMGYLKQAGNIPCEIKRMAIDGNIAFVHVRYLNWAGKEHAGIDIFRFDADGKILEHWDVLQPVPEAASNDNTMF